MVNKPGSKYPMPNEAGMHSNPSESEPKSKRTPVRLRHRIEKASAAKQRKQRKLAKKNPEWRTRLRKDPGIPNLFPYKDRILHEIEQKKRLKQEEASRRREGLKAPKSESHGADDVVVTEETLNGGDRMEKVDMEDASNPMEALLASAKAQAAKYEEVSDDDDDDDESNGMSDVSSGDGIGPTHNHDFSRRAFDQVYKTVLSSADIILYVLDARDPNGTRSREIEREIMAANSGSKRLILILNKIDLVPPSVLKAWLAYLRISFPALPLRASNPAPNARTFDHKAFTVRGTSETLLRALKTYAHEKSLKRSTTVGILGYPNVGKSSVINALVSRLGGARRSQATACPVGAEAGVTTALREVKLDNKLKLIDSPGIVFPPSDSDGETEGNRALIQNKDRQNRLILLNAIPPKTITDPVPAVTLLLRRLSESESGTSNLLSVYDLPPLILGADGDVTTDFLVQVARRRGRLGKGGVPNLSAAAMTVITDWRDGRIQGWTDAPTLQASSSDQKEIVSEWAAEFKLDGGKDVSNQDIMEE
ncbi:MAG: hypothetical protein Q9214_004786 [Letrouitia sp. 1 TL-2023]